MNKKFILLAFLFISLQSIAIGNKSDFWTKKWMDNTPAHGLSKGNHLKMLHGHDWSYKNRRLLHEAAHDYLIQLEFQNAYYIDPELEDYLYQLVHKIHPNAFPKQQKIQLNVKVIKSVIPETFTFANGTILISTGMISLLQSEDELVGILAREIAHLTLDHNVKEYNALQTKKTISAILGAGAYVASTFNALDKGRNFWEADYLGSFVGASTELLSYGLLSALGLGYNRSRTYDADEIAQEWMIESGHNPYALPQAIRRLQHFEEKQRGTSQALTENRFFLKNRFKNVVGKKKFNLNMAGFNSVAIDINYDSHITECLKTNAKLLVADQFYKDAIPYLNRSINSNWTSGETYLLKAIALRHTQYSEEVNREIISLLDKAKENAVTNLPWVWSEKGIVYLRLKEDEKALNAFLLFEEYFTEDQTEISLWARKMVAKLKKKKTLN